MTGRASLAARSSFALPLLCAIALMVRTSPVAADEPSIKVTVSRNNIYLGESVIMEVRVSGADNDSRPDLSRIANSSTRFLGRQEQNFNFISIVNGVTRREGFNGSIFSYEITPTRAGDITLGPITVKVGAAVLSDPGPSITVTGIQKQDIVGISVTASRETVLVDEPFEVRLAVRIRKLPGQYSEHDPLFPDAPPTLTVPFVDAQGGGGLRGPDIRKLLESKLAGRGRAGFAINNYTTQNDPFDLGGFFNMENPFGPKTAVFGLDRKAVEQDGKICFEYSMSLQYQPLEEGTYTFGPVVFKGQVPVQINAGGQASGAEVFAVGPASVVRVVPPPAENRPVSYIGALGSNLTVEAGLDAQTCNIGDPLKLTLTINGPIQVRNVFPARLGLQTNLAARFEIYDDNVRISKKDSSVQFIYTLRPLGAGAFELPPIAISYYDVAERRYKTARTVPIPLKVRQATEVTASQIIGHATNAPSRQPPDDSHAMVPASMRMDSTGSEPSALIANPRALGVAAGLGPAVFLFTLGLRQVLIRRGSFLRARRRRKAFDVALKSLKHADQPGAVNPSETHARLCRVMRQYLSDRLDLPAAAATPGDVQSMLDAAGVPEDVTRRFGDAMERHFNAAFGTTAGPASKQAVDEVKQAIAALETAAAGRAAPFRQNGTTIHLLVVLAGAAMAQAVMAAAPVERQFMWSEANARFMAAQTPADYLGAANAYQKLVDLGVRNSSVFFNEGTALLLAGRYDDSVQVLLRAERYNGGSKDISRNLGIARARRDKVKTPVVPWNRVVLFWHFDLSCTARAWVAAAAFSLVWLVLATRLVGWRKGFTAVLAVLILVLILFGSSVLATMQIDSASRRPFLTPPPAATSPPASGNNPTTAAIARHPQSGDRT